MTAIVAILTLLEGPVTAGLAAAPPLEITSTVEHIPLPALHGPLALHLDAYESTVTLEAPAADLSRLLRALRKASRLICPSVQERDGQVQLHCRTRRLTAQLTAHGDGAQILELRELAALPWDALDQAPPLVLFDLAALGMGGPCPGDTLAAQGECALAEGKPDEAARLFREALSTPGAPLAAIRLGDLALSAGDVVGAVRSWTRVSHETPWGAVAYLRLCELDAKCLDSPRAAMAKALVDLPRALRADALLRGARREAFQGHALEAASTLATETGPDGACSASAPFCRRILLAALREPGQRGSSALALYLDVPNRDRGPYAVELARAAADRSEEAGAPVFGANLLAVVAGRVPVASLPWHLLRTVELYLDGGDRARARVVAEFARARLGRAALLQPRWQAALRRGSSKREASPLREAERELEADLAAAQAALHAASGGVQ